MPHHPQGWIIHEAGEAEASGPGPQQGPGPPGTTKMYKVGLLQALRYLERIRLMNVSMPWLSWLLKATQSAVLILSLLLTGLHPSRRVKRSCKPNSSVCSSKCSAIGSSFTVCPLKPYCRERESLFATTQRTNIQKYTK